MSAARRRQDPVTAEELYELPDDGSRHELLRGTLVSEPVPGSLHGRIVARLAELLGSFVRPRRLGVVYAGDAGFILARKPDTVRGPDVAFVSMDRQQRVESDLPYFSGAPDLAIEVLSPGDRMNEVLGKVSDYLAAGCRLVWLVDPVREEVQVFRSPFTPRLVVADERLEGEDVVAGFSVGSPRSSASDPEDESPPHVREADSPRCGGSADRHAAAAVVARGLEHVPVGAAGTAHDRAVDCMERSPRFFPDPSGRRARGFRGMLAVPRFCRIPRTTRR